MEIIDNVNKTLKDDMLVILRSGSKTAIATSSFSIYIFQELLEIKLLIKSVNLMNSDYIF